MTSLKPDRMAAALALLLGCGSDTAIQRVESVQPGDSDPSSEGTGGSGGSGNGGAQDVGSGAGASPVAEPASDVISVDEGEFQEGSEPAPTQAATLPTIVSLTGPVAVTNGGSALLHVTLDPPVPAPAFVVALDGDAGYHVVDGSDVDGDGTYDIRVQVAGEATQTSLLLRVAVTSGGVTGPYSELAVELVQSGQGDVKITLSFDRTHDLDLAVVEPNGEEISYQNDASATGGLLDLDSGANCVPDSANSENIFWPPGGAPSGEYRVFVQNFQHCTPGEIRFNVRIAYDSTINIYPGTFADGSEGQRVEIATFRR